MAIEVDKLTEEATRLAKFIHPGVEIEPGKVPGVIAVHFPGHTMHYSLSGNNASKEMVSLAEKEIKVRNMQGQYGEALHAVIRGDGPAPMGGSAMSFVGECALASTQDRLSALLRMIE